MLDPLGPPGPAPPRGEHRRRRRRSTFLRRRVALVAVMVVVAAVLFGSLGGPGRRTPSATATAHGPVVTSAVRHPTTTTVTPTTATTVPPTTTTSTVGPGSLPQTDQLPTTADPAFAAAMGALWDGIVADDPRTAMPAFFPEGAYIQLKDIAGVSSDYTDRLAGEYGLDITAAHQLLGADPEAAQFVGVDAEASYAHWVPPGVCDNGVGYYELPNARVVYTVGGQTSSFGIASMISWRGEWYVIHLGAILRSGSGGEVDDPEPGRGTSAYSGTC